MNLTDAFNALQNIHSFFDTHRLLAYSEEDDQGGRDTGEYPIEVSINSVEGQFLYALTRLLVPPLVLEIGTADGCSAVHLLAALRANRTDGLLVSVDIDDKAGRTIPEGWRSRWRLIVGDATLVPMLPVWKGVDLVFEDARHDYESTKTTLLRLRALNPKVVISHDYYRHLFDTKVGVKQAFDEVFGDEVIPIWFDETRTGMGVWINRKRLP